MDKMGRLLDSKIRSFLRLLRTYFYTMFFIGRLLCWYQVFDNLFKGSQAFQNEIILIASITSVASIVFVNSISEVVSTIVLIVTTGIVPKANSETTTNIQYWYNQYFLFGDNNR